MRFDKWQHEGGRNGSLRVGISARLVGADNLPDLVSDEGSRIGKGTPGITDIKNCLFFFGARAPTGPWPPHSRGF